jgi:hypothetical protein
MIKEDSNEFKIRHCTLDLSLKEKMYFKLIFILIDNIF